MAPVTLIELAPRLVLRYDPGQFTFRNFNPTASDTQLFNLANQLNSFQEDEVDEIFKVRTFEF